MREPDMFRLSLTFCMVLAAFPVQYISKHYPQFQSTAGTVDRHSLGWI